MKKLIFVFAGLFFTLTSLFADKVLLEKDLNSDWIIGNWNLDLIVEENDQTEKESGYLKIKGKKDDSEVILKFTEGEESATLDDLKEIMFVSFKEHMPFLEETLEQAVEYGLSITGDTDWHVSDDNKKIYYEIALSNEEERLAVSIVFTKE